MERLNGAVGAAGQLLRRLQSDNTDGVKSEWGSHIQGVDDNQSVTISGVDKVRWGCFGKTWNSNTRQWWLYLEG